MADLPHLSQPSHAQASDVNLTISRRGYVKSMRTLSETRIVTLLYGVPDLLPRVMGVPHLASQDFPPFYIA
jgi:Flp pilus assembly protein TadG